MRGSTELPPLCSVSPVPQKEAGRRDLIGHAQRIAEAECDLRRARRARQTLARLPVAATTGYRREVSQFKTVPDYALASASGFE